jgi:toxin ParE1/3/4
VDYHIVYTQRALNDLAEIIRYIAEDNREAATRFGNALLDHIDLLQHYPRMGSTIRERANVRRLVHSPIVVYYQVHEGENAVEILHVRHGSRQPPRF